MSEYLLVTGEDPVELDGSIDGTGALQMVHGSDSLADYEQTLHAEHEDLDDPGGEIRIKLVDFSSGGASWTMSASHMDGSNQIDWTSGTGHVYYDFEAMSSELEVDVTATDDSNPPQDRTRKIYIKTKPTGTQK